MSAYLLDTNILLRISYGSSANHLLAGQASARLISQGHQIYITSQNLIEFWAVATRPLAVNGLGLSPQETTTIMTQFMNRFQILEDTPDVFPHWLRLVTTYDIKGKKTHDARLVAIMLAYKVMHLLTFNTDDFSGYAEITLIHPSAII